MRPEGKFLQKHSELVLNLKAYFNYEKDLTY